VSGSGISCQHPTIQFFTGRMPFLPPNQQRQSTEIRYNSTTKQQQQNATLDCFLYNDVQNKLATLKILFVIQKLDTVNRWQVGHQLHLHW